MKLVIEIPDQKYKWIVDNPQIYTDDLCEAIRNGEQLPEHHGRLIDADAMQKYQIDTFGQRLLVIDTAPTIIEGSDSE